jgi:hypothetical protein
MLSTPVTVAIDGPCQTASWVKNSRLRVVAVEDLSDEPPSDLDPLVDRQHLTHAASPPSRPAGLGVLWRIVARGQGRSHPGKP